jgi:hypothetical protein
MIDLRATLWEFQQQRRLCDVGVGLRGTDLLIPCHRVVLAAGSLYFRGLFSKAFPESTAATITVSTCVSDRLFRDAIRFLYTEDSAFINQANALETYALASYLQIAALQAATEPFFNQMGKDAFDSALTLLGKRSCPVCPTGIIGCIAQHFHRTDSKQLVNLPRSILISAVEHPGLQIRSDLQLIKVLSEAHKEQPFHVNQREVISRAVAWELLLPDEWEIPEVLELADSRHRGECIGRARNAIRSYATCPRVWLAMTIERPELLKRLVEPVVARFFDLGDTLDAKFKIDVAKTGLNALKLTAREGGFWLQKGEFDVEEGRAKREVQLVCVPLLGGKSFSKAYPLQDSHGCVAFNMSILCKEVTVQAMAKLKRASFAGFSFDTT